MARATMHFPPDFRWGTATAAFQVEGENKNSDWWAWEQQPERILNGGKSGLACNWWQNAEADLDLAAEMGNNAHRLSVEWSRIEPMPSVFDEEVLERYRRLLQGMHDRGLEPMVTLHHFSNPLWLVDKGDFNSDVTVEYFRRFTAKVVATLGDLVPLWVTFNEPMVYITQRYLLGKFPAPRQSGWSAAMAAVRNMLRCHAAAYQAIKELQPEAQVGVAKNIAVFQGRRNYFIDRGWAGQIDRVYNRLWLDALQDGRLRWPFGRGPIDGLAGSSDFIGLNYYTRLYAHFPPGRNDMYGVGNDPETITSDGDYGEIYPQGLFQSLRWLQQYKQPIFITENGLPDEADQHRPAFLFTHLREVWRAVSFNYPIMGYYHWSLVDNFEWDRGWTQRFGLVAMDPETQERNWRTSGRLYQEICRQGGISSDQVERYAPQIMPELFPG